MNYQFNPSLLESIPEIQEQVSYQIRPLALSDYENGILQVLKQLTHVGEISKDQFTGIFIDKIE
jgi:glucosamine-phosphate N-acetyltransferase